jgi:hypothetical protein
MTPIESLLKDREKAKQQMVRWSRAVATLDKKIERERANASGTTYGLQPERKGILAPRPARQERLRDGG